MRTARICAPLASRALEPGPLGGVPITAVPSRILARNIGILAEAWRDGASGRLCLRDAQGRVCGALPLARGGLCSAQDALRLRGALRGQPLRFEPGRPPAQPGDRLALGCLVLELIHAQLQEQPGSLDSEARVQLLPPTERLEGLVNEALLERLRTRSVVVGALLRDGTATVAELRALRQLQVLAVDEPQGALPDPDPEPIDQDQVMDDLGIVALPEDPEEAEAGEDRRWRAVIDMGDEGPDPDERWDEAATWDDGSVAQVLLGARGQRPGPESLVVGDTTLDVVPFGVDMDEREAWQALGDAGGVLVAEDHSDADTSDEQFSPAGDLADAETIDEAYDGEDPGALLAGELLAEELLARQLEDEAAGEPALLQDMRLGLASMEDDTEELLLHAELDADEFSVATLGVVAAAGPAVPEALTGEISVRDLGRRDPELAEVQAHLLNRARAELAAGQPHDALASLGRAWALSPGDPVVRVHQAWAQLLLGEGSQAALHAARAVADAPYDPMVMRLAMALSGHVGTTVRS